MKLSLHRILLFTLPLIGHLYALAASAQLPQPNIVLIVSDDHGTDALGCYGNPVIRTPNLDTLAREGIRFTHTFCTTPSCSTSRSVILTGRYNHRTGMYGHEHREHHFRAFSHVPSLPVMLEEAGYRTVRIGKFHIAPESVFRFETVLSPGIANDPESIGRSPVEMAEGAKEFIAASDNRPFFLYFATDDPHRANLVAPDGKATFDSYPDPNPFGNLDEGYPGIDPVTYSPNDVIVPPFLPDTPECRAELAEYYQAVSRLDQGIGRLIEILKEAGKYENTLIIYISDNGVAFAGAKTNLYDPGIRLPCIIRSPRQTGRGIVEDAMITWADLTPTILDFARVPLEGKDFDGRSFRPALEDGELSGWDEIYASHTFHEVTMYYPMRMVRTREYKLIWNIASGLTFPSAADLIVSPTWISATRMPTRMYGPRRIDDYLRRPSFELYQLDTDPDEVSNLAADPAYSDIREALIKKIQLFQEQTKDPWIHKWIYE